GARVPRVDGKEKVTGAAAYAADIALPRALVGKVLRSPYPHARLLHIDTSKARRVPGVKAVITAEDTPKIPHGLFVKDTYPLALERVRYVGDEVAAVAAASEEAASEALELIEVEYEELPAVFDPLEAMAPGAPQLHADRPGNIAYQLSVERGDVEAGFQQAAHVIEERFTTHATYHAYLEPIASVVSYGHTGKLTVWASAQEPFMTQAELAEALHLPPSDIHFIQPHVGGAFGGKTMDDNHLYISCLLALKTRAAVKLVNTREDEFVASRPRVPTVIDLKVGFAGDGAIVAKEARVVSDNGAYTSRTPVIMRTTCIRADSLYRLQNLRTHGYLVYTNKIPTGSMRGFGNPQMHFALESVMDMAARELGMDPLALRLRNATQAGDVTVHGWRVASCGLSECLERTAAEVGWRGARPAPGASGTKRRGVGLACATHVSGRRHFGNYDGSSALVKVNEDGRVVVLSGEGDVGQGSRTIFAQIAAEELGVPYEDVDVTMADTESTPFGMGSHASKVTFVGGNAVRVAAADARRQLLEITARLFEARAEDLAIQDGRIFHRELPQRALTVAEAAKAHIYRQGGEPVIGKGAWDPPSELHDKTFYGNISGAYPFGACAAEVEVDVESGEVKVLRIVSAADVGRAINPMLAEGQIEGGVIQGLGYALCEEIRNEEGRVLNPNFSDYRIMACEDIPVEVKAILVEPVDPYGPFGAKGLGELVVAPVAPAVANAVAHAVGARITSLPITAEKLFTALRRPQASRPATPNR
ncbi:MAG: xanthine dehydrogenase family protein, partial [Deltaproteobacteria bacterium]|nr:xanthine dehydrogenase family protein [Deltaproteobacteria bacterium]